MIMIREINDINKKRPENLKGQNWKVLGGRNLRENRKYARDRSNS